jgi:hypothetical protein
MSISLNPNSFTSQWSNGQSSRVESEKATTPAEMLLAATSNSDKPRMTAAMALELATRIVQQFQSDPQAALGLHNPQDLGGLLGGSA